LFNALQIGDGSRRQIGKSRYLCSLLSDGHSGVRSLSHQALPGEGGVDVQCLKLVIFEFICRYWY
jgi:hypothetical protein